MTVILKFQLGQKVYSAVDPDARGLVAGITIRPGGLIYLVVWEDREETPHYDIELSETPVRDFAD